MPNSGAFRSLHCLIYKVLAAAFSVAERLLSYHTFSSLSSTFFDFFQIFFVPARPLRLRLKACLFYHTLLNLSSTFFDSFESFFLPDRSFRFRFESLIILSRFLRFVKYFFPFLPLFLFLDSPASAPWLTARLIYQILPPLSTPFLKNF